VSLGDFTRFEEEQSANDASVGGLFESGWEEAHNEGLTGLVILHENGQQCWNGPRRSVKVGLYCSAVNELRSVREEEKCVYRFEVGTAAVCGDDGLEDGNSGGAEKARDEL
jgi:protein kinase C substrate 80K-H